MILNKIKENMSDSRSKILNKFLVTLTQKTDRAIALKLLSVIHSPLKVDRFELLTDWSYIVRFMIDEKQGVEFISRI